MRVPMLLLALTLAACGAISPVEPRVPAALDETFTLRVGQRAVFAGPPLELAFEDVLEDSRCPIGVTCVWAGNARVRLHLSEGGAARRLIELNTGVDPRQASELDYRVELVGLEPAPEVNRTVSKDRYVARLRVSRAP